jgi:hypothetical protein
MSSTRVMTLRRVVGSDTLPVSITSTSRKWTLHDLQSTNSGTVSRSPPSTVTFASHPPNTTMPPKYSLTRYSRNVRCRKVNSSSHSPLAVARRPHSNPCAPAPVPLPRIPPSTPPTPSPPAHYRTGFRPAPRQTAATLVRVAPATSRADGGHHLVAALRASSAATVERNQAVEVTASRVLIQTALLVGQTSQRHHQRRTAGVL